MLISPFAKSASSLSKTGSPRPAGKLEIETSIFAPTESPSLLSLSIKFSMDGTISESGQKNGFLSISSASKSEIFIEPYLR